MVIISLVLRQPVLVLLRFSVVTKSVLTPSLEFCSPVVIIRYFQAALPSARQTWLHVQLLISGELLARKEAIVTLGLMNTRLQAVSPVFQLSVAIISIRHQTLLSPNLLKSQR